MKNLKDFLNSKLNNQETTKIKGGGHDGQMGIFCEWYVSYTGNNNMPAVHSDTNPGIANNPNVNGSK